MTVKELKQKIKNAPDSAIVTAFFKEHDFVVFDVDYDEKVCSLNVDHERIRKE